LVRQQQEAAWCVVREDARNRETGFGLTVRPQHAKDGGDSTCIFVPIVESPDPTISTHIGTSSQPGLQLIADHTPFPERRECIVRGPALEPGASSLQFAQSSAQYGVGLVRLEGLFRIHAHPSVGSCSRTLTRTPIPLPPRH